MPSRGVGGLFIKQECRKRVLLSKAGLCSGFSTLLLKTVKCIHINKVTKCFFLSVCKTANQNSKGALKFLKMLTVTQQRYLIVSVSPFWWLHLSLVAETVFKPAVTGPHDKEE